MQAALALMLTNATAAALIAAVALLASRLVRRPAVGHALWLLALLKLVTPPLLPVPLLPSGEALPALVAWSGLAGSKSPTIVRLAPLPSSPPCEATRTAARLPVGAPQAAGLPLAAAFPQGVRLPQAVSAPEAPDPGAWNPGREARADRLGRVATLGLGAGALAVLALAAWRFARFRRLLAWAEPAPAAVTARTAELAAELGLRRVPPVLVVPARISPMLWLEPHGPWLLLPRDLLGELTQAERDALLAHELAHLHRRDHWVRLVELVASALFWWYPVSWWIRAALRRAEERCCDEWVLRVLPRSAEAYAQGLLKSLTFVSSAPAAVPALASGVSPVHELELRLKEILMSRPTPHLATPLRIALLAAAGVGLAVFPTQATPWAVQAPAPAPAPASAPSPAARPRPDSRSESDTERALEAELRGLEAKRRVLQQQELALHRQEIELHARAEQAELRAVVEDLRARGETREAEAYEKRAELSAQRMGLERQRVELDAERLALQLQLETELRGEHPELTAREVERELERKQRAIEDAARAMELRMQALDAEQQIREMAGATEAMARELAGQADAVRAALRESGIGPEIEREISRLEAAVAALRAEATRAAASEARKHRPAPKP